MKNIKVMMDLRDALRGHPARPAISNLIELKRAQAMKMWSEDQKLNIERGLAKNMRQLETRLRGYPLKGGSQGNHQLSTAHRTDKGG